jgi:hypothetical protein
LVNTSYSFPRPNGQCIFDVSKLVQQYVYPLPYDVATISTPQVSLTNETAQYYCLFTEVFDTVGPVVGTESSNIIWSWLGAANWESGKNLTTYSANYIPSSIGAKWLGPLDYVEPYQISTTDKRVVSIVARNKDATFRVSNMVLKTNSGKVFEKTLSIATTTDPKNLIWNIPVGINELNGMSWTTKTAPTGLTTSITISEDSSYYIYFRNEVTDDCDSHKKLYFDIQDCSRFDDWSALYQTPCGGWWYIHMNMKNYSEESIKQTTRGSYLPYNYDFNDAQTKITSIDAVGSIILNTDYLSNQNRVQEVMDMVKSPNVFLVKNNIYTPVIVKAANYQNGNIKQDKLISYTITFEEAFNKNICI